MWRNSGLPFMFFGIDGRAIFALLLLMYLPSKKMFYACMLFFFILFILNHFGYNIPNGIRRVKVFIAGDHRSAIPLGFK